MNIFSITQLIKLIHAIQMMMNFFVIMVNVSVVYSYVMVNFLCSLIIFIYFLIDVAHCLDGSDELLSHCTSTTNERTNMNNHKMSNKHRSWRGISIIFFLILIFIGFTLLMVYFICRRFVQPSPISLLNHHEQKNYSTIVNSRMLFSIKKIFI